MKLLIPDGFDIKITSKKNKKFIFNYKEFFGNNTKPKLNKKQISELIERTISILSPALASQFGMKNVTIKRASKQLGIHLKIDNVNREQVANFMVGEFMHSCSIGELKIGDLMQ